MQTGSTFRISNTAYARKCNYLQIPIHIQRQEDSRTTSGKSSPNDEETTSET